MGTYTFEKGKDGQIRRFRNGAFQETATNSEFQLLQQIEELEAKEAIMLEVVKAVAHIGIDFGYGAFELQKEHIDMARKIYEAKETD